MKERGNDDWLVELGGSDPVRHAALEDLRRLLLRGLRRALGAQADEALLEDAVQVALLRILDRLHQFEGRSRFVTWATSIAVRVVMSERRRQRWTDVSLEDVLEPVAGRPDDGDRFEEPALAWERKAMITKMHDVMDRHLTPRQKAVLTAELRGMPQEEIARHLGSNRNAVYKLTHDARKSLKRALEAAGYGPADLHSATAG